MPWIDKLIQAAILGKAADYTQDRLEFEAAKSPEPILDAEDLRRIILGLRSAADPVDFNPAMCFHWDIRGLRITGRLDLSDGRLPSGSSLPALEFIDCTFDGGICADGAHLERLHLSGCRFGTLNQATTQISLRSVRIENELRLSRLKPIAEDGPLRVDAGSAHVGANLILKRLELRAPPNQEVEDPITTPFALNLRNATIRADLLLQPELTIHGGFTAVGAHIGGDLRATGLIADDGEDPAFRQEVRNRKGRLRAAVALDSARIAGNLYFFTKDDQRVCRLDGEVSMQGIHIEGKLDFRGVALDSGSAGVDSLYLWGAVIKGGLYCLESETIQGTKVQNSFNDAVVLNRCTITESLTIQGSFATLHAEGLSVQGDVRLDTELGLRKKPGVIVNDDEGNNAYAVFVLTSANISGSLVVGSRYTNKRWEPRPEGPEGYLSLQGATIGGDFTAFGTFDLLYAKRLTVNGNTNLPATIIYHVELSKADLRGDLDLSEFKFLTRGPVVMRAKLPTPLFSLVDADIKRSLRLGEPVSQDHQILFAKARYCKPLCYPQLRIVEIGAKKNVPGLPNDREFWAAFLLFPRRAATSLDGRSSPFHEINANGFLHIRNPQEQSDYIRLFCAYVWGAEGPFKIVESKTALPAAIPGQNLPDLKTIEISRDPARREVIFADAHVWYGANLFKAKFELFLTEINSGAKKGVLNMTEDEPVGEFKQKEPTIYDSPLFYGHEHEGPIYAGIWKDIESEKDLNQWIPNWKVPFRQKTVSFENALIDLSDASCGTLEDADGVAWGSDVTLQLENFTYSRIKATSESTDEMIAWPWKLGSAYAEKVWTASHRVQSSLRPLHRILRRSIGFPDLPLPDLRTDLGQKGPRWFSNLQNSGLRRTGVRERFQWLEQRKVLQPNSRGDWRFEPFLQQPYTQLAKIFREQGDETEARQVEAQRIRIDRWLRAKQSFGGKLALPIFGLYRIFFLYGLSPVRASVTFLFCLALGWAATAFVNNHHGLLVQSTSTVATAISMNGDPTIPIVPFQPMSGQSTFDCGRSISESLYAIDVFIPLLDLRQEGRCDIRSISNKDVQPMSAFRSAAGTRGAVLRGSWRALASMLFYPPLWQWLKSMYAMLGWIVTSLTILTFSGTLRKWDQGK